MSREDDKPEAHEFFRSLPWLQILGCDSKSCDRFWTSSVICLSHPLRTPIFFMTCNGTQFVIHGPVDCLRSTADSRLRSRRRILSTLTVNPTLLSCSAKGSLSVGTTMQSRLPMILHYRAWRCWLASVHMRRTYCVSCCVLLFWADSSLLILWGQQSIILLHKAPITLMWEQSSHSSFITSMNPSFCYLARLSMLSLAVHVVRCWGHCTPQSALDVPASPPSTDFVPSLSIQFHHRSRPTAPPSDPSASIVLLLSAK